MPYPALLRKYQAIVGSLLYCATQTRPDVAFAVGYLGRALGKPTPELYSIALSSTEAEVVAASEAAKEAIYLDRLHAELGFKGSSEPIQLALDNKAAIDSSYNPENHSRTKHIDRRHYFLRELVEEGRIVVPFVSTADNYADFFTKPLKPARFFHLRNLIMNIPSSEL